MAVDTAVKTSYGVHSEVGRLPKVLVCAPGLAHARLTPGNCDDLLFDDVLWVERAREDHARFVHMMVDRGVDVVELHELLAEMLAIPRARAWLLDRKITAGEVGLGLVADTRAFLDGLDDHQLARYLIGGLATTDLPAGFRSAGAAAAGTAWPAPSSATRWAVDPGPYGQSRPNGGTMANPRNIRVPVDQGEEKICKHRCAPRLTNPSACSSRTPRPTRSPASTKTGPSSSRRGYGEPATST